jgi:hypothetical protein
MKNPKKLFDKKMVYPNCHSTFDTKKPILSRLKVIDFETDGHKIYKDSSPLWYELNVCPICGFVFDERLNNTLYTEDIEKLLTYFSTVKDFKKYCEERTLDDSIRVSQLALVISNTIEEPKTLRGAHCLKTSWLYREKKDIVNEEKFLNMSKVFFEEAFEEEDFEYFGLKLHVLYNILSETSRKLNLYDDASKYYSKLFRCSTTPNYMKQKAQNNWLDYNNR